MGGNQSHDEEGKGVDEKLIDEEYENTRQQQNVQQVLAALKKQNKTNQTRIEANQGRMRLTDTLHNSMKATLGGDVQATVVLPPGEDKKEWIAVNTVHFVNAAKMIFGTCDDFCTRESCPIMRAGQKYVYLWKGEGKNAEAQPIPARDYITNVLEWANDKISDTRLFPLDDSNFPRDFMSVVKTMFKRIFRMYAHIYYHHFDNIKGIGANAHLNTCFKHFVFFVKEFNLVEDKEMIPLQKLVAKFYRES